MNLSEKFMFNQSCLEEPAQIKLRLWINWPVVTFLRFFFNYYYFSISFFLLIGNQQKQRNRIVFDVCFHGILSTLARFHRLIHLPLFSSLHGFGAHASSAPSGFTEICIELERGLSKLLIFQGPN